MYTFYAWSRGPDNRKVIHRKTCFVFVPVRSLGHIFLCGALVVFGLARIIINMGHSVSDSRCLGWPGTGPGTLFGSYDIHCLSVRMETVKNKFGSAYVPLSTVTRGIGILSPIARSLWRTARSYTPSGSWCAAIGIGFGASGEQISISLGWRTRVHPFSC